MERLLYTVSGFVEMVNLTLEHALPGGTFAVEGEVSSYNVTQGQWVRFDLKDEAAIVNCFLPLWQLTEQLTDGLRVVVTGEAKLYSRYGKFTLNVQSIRLVGAGSLRRAFQLLQKKLQDEGLFAVERKRALPRWPERVALVTSREAAAYKDFLRVAAERWPSATVFHFATAVQGEKAVSSVAAAVRAAGAQPAAYDVVALVRGGGSLEDLHVFNTEEVARAIFSAAVPVVVGVGHERDVTIADLVADVRAATPSNAAEIIFPDQKEVLATLQHFRVRQEQFLRAQLSHEQQRVTHMIYAADAWWRQIWQRLLTARECLQGALGTVAERIGRQKQAVLAARRLLESLHPRRILTRGFSYTKNASGRIITSVAALSSGEEVTQVYQDGEAPMIVK